MVTHPWNLRTRVITPATTVRSDAAHEGAEQHLRGYQEKVCRGSDIAAPITGPQRYPHAGRTLTGAGISPLGPQIQAI